MEAIIKNKNTLAVGVICLVLGYFYGSKGIDLKGEMSHENMGNMDMNMEMGHDMKMSGDGHDHKHAVVANNKPIPTVSLEAFPDTMGGYNIQIKTTNYTFTPKEAGKENTPNTGHAHVYVNEVKVGRAYGEWYNIPKSFFHTGMNTISVSLNGNDHSVWVLNDGKTEVAAAEMVEVK